MSRNLIIAFVAVLIFGGGYGAWTLYGDRSDAGFALLNDDEIARYLANPPQKTRSLMVTKSSGPLIKVTSPSGFALSSPVDFDIRVEPRGGVDVDMKSLRIEYKLGPIWVNLTRRVMREAKIKGLRFSARGAELPAGNHSLRLTVRDKDARTTQAMVNFSVKK